MFNFRDIGGGAPAAGGVVRRGVVLRSDALVGLDEADHDMLSQIGIRTAIDLREAGEREHSSTALRDVDLHEIELIGGDPTGLTLSLVRFNQWMLAERGERLAAVIGLLAAPGALPGVYFCSSGKDRTGLVTALILSVLGVEDAPIVRDYALTAELMPEEYMAEAVNRAIAGGLPEEMLDGYKEHGLGSPPDVMESTLQEISGTYGGAAEYLLSHGVQRTELDALRAALIDPS